MAVKQLDYTAEQLDSALGKKDLLKDVSAVNASPGDVADSAKYVDIDGVHTGTLKTLTKKDYEYGSTQQVIKSGSIIVEDQTIKKVTTQTKTVSIDTADQNIKPDAGRVLTRVIVNRLPSDAIGSDYQEIAEQTITPTVYDIVLVEDGVKNKYLRNNKVVVSGDTNLRSENIKKDVTIFGVTGSYEKDPNMEYPSSDGKQLTTYGLIGNYDWTGITYGGGKFVACSGSTAKIAYSEDGVSWTLVNTPNAISKVTYGNGMFVGILTSSSVSMSSTDGINWTIANLPQALQYTSIAYGNNRFVAIANDSNMGVYSEDGVTWQNIYFSDQSNWKSICYGNGKFVAITYGSKGVINVSLDGINWDKANAPAESDNDLYAVAYGNGKFVAIANTSSTAIYSSDGVNWTKTSIPYAYWMDVCFGNGRFVAISNPNSNYNRSAYSTDGIIWNTGTLSTAASWAAVIYGASKFVAVGRSSSNGIESCYTTVGDVWTQADTIMSGVNWNSVSYGDSKYVAIGAGSTTTLSKALLVSYSYDGVNWQGSMITGNIKWNSVIYSCNKFIAVGSNIDSIITSSSNITPLGYSYDGINWFQLPSTSALATERMDIKKVTYGNGRAVAVAANASLYTLDGIKWVAGGQTMDGCKDVCFGKNRFVCASQGAIAYSADSINWSQSVPPANMIIQAICYGGSKFIAIGCSTSDAKMIMYATSTDGITWASGTNANYKPDDAIIFNSITYANGKYLAVGATASSAAKAVYSTNGTVWKVTETDMTTTLTCVIRGKDNFLAIGKNTSITLTSYTTNDRVTEVETPYANSPTLTIQNSYLNITPVSSATGYVITIVGTSEIAYGLFTTSLRVNLSEYVNNIGTYDIHVRACVPGWMRSNTSVISYIIS